MSSQFWDVATKATTVLLPILTLLVGFLGYRLNAMVAVRDSDRKDHEALQQRVEFWRNDNDKLTAQLETIRKDHQDLNTSYVALSTMHNETRSQLETEQAHGRSMGEDLARKAEQITNLQSNVDKQTAALTTATGTIDTLHHALEQERIAADANITRVNNDSLEQQRLLQNQIDNLTKEIAAAKQEIADLRKQMGELDSLNQNFSRQILALEKERDEKNQQIATLITERDEARRELAGFKTSPKPVDPGAELRVIAVPQ